MSDPTALLERLLSGDSLTEAQANGLLHQWANGGIAEALGGGLLAALRAKGEQAEEIRGFATAMRELAIKPPFDASQMVDIVGTGGDGSGSLNLSTGAALLAAACGTQVVKHGNRSVSSLSGSADVLDAMGFPWPKDGEEAKNWLDIAGFTFLFAPFYHPAMKHIAPVRAAMGVRTLFNILGPLANPAQPGYHVIGAFSLDMARLMAQTLSGMPLNRAFVVHGAEGWDEATPVGPFHLIDVRPMAMEERVLDPEAFGIPACTADELKGGDGAENARRLRSVLVGEEHGAHREALVLGAALALEVSGRCSNLSDAIRLARDALDEGAGKALLQRLETACRP